MVPWSQAGRRLGRAQWWSSTVAGGGAVHADTPTDQAWIETLFGQVETEWSHLETITDPDTLHASLGYVTSDQHHGRGGAIR